MNFYDLIGLGWLNYYPDWFFRVAMFGVTKEEFAKWYIRKPDNEKEL